MKRIRKSLIAYLSSLILLPFVVALANEETALFKIQDSGLVVSSNYAGDKILGHRSTVENLLDRAAVSQADFVSTLETLKSENLIKDYKAYWIANVIAVTADSEILEQLSQRGDIEQVGFDYPVELIAPVESDLPSIAGNGAENGLRVIRAPQAWALGLDGAGSLVCNFDTGVNGNHAALVAKYHGNRGGSPNACWFDPFTNTEYPTDLQGHGTHTMGTMVGSDGEDTVGVAPGAEWIAAAVVERGGGVQRTITDILAAFQWAADPDGDPSTTDDVPDVINNSWGIPIGYYPSCEGTFWEAIDNLEAAGVVCIFAAGNEGSNPLSIRTPADRITSDFNAFSVGAIDGNSPENMVASFSSRGPSGCDGITIKPEVTAPGVGIRSAGRNGGYVQMSGTSMAAPHVAGAVAILRQFNPHATPVEIKQALMNSARDLGQPGEDNDYGWGVIDIRRAIDFMPVPETPFIALSGVAIAGDGIIVPGESTELSIIAENIGAGVSNIVASILSSDFRITVGNDNRNIVSFEHGQIATFGPWEINASEQVALGEIIPMMMFLSGQNYSDTIHFHVVIGGEATPAIANVGNSAVELSFSNFGALGLNDRSLTPMGGTGFRILQSGQELLRNGSLILASDSSHVSDAAMGCIPDVSDYDFAPVRGGQARVSDDGMMQSGFAKYNDSLAESPIGVEVTQRTFCWSTVEAPIVVVEFGIRNISGAAIDNFNIGMLCDWDMGQSDGNQDIAGYFDQVGYISDADGGGFAGIVPLNNQASSYVVINNETYIDGFSESEKYSALNAGFTNTIGEMPGNYSHILSIGQINIAADDSFRVAFALVAGSSFNELSLNAQQAGVLYNQTTSLTETPELPESHMIVTNYPNPFNSSTMIEIAGGNNTNDVISIFDIMGRLIKELPAGGGNAIWDGTEANGNAAAAGIYFARLNGQTQARKMLLIK